MVRSLAQNKKFIVIVGPTASGKSALAMRICREFGGDLVSCDSVQVYHGLDIGSAKPSLQERQQVAHHMVDIVRLDEDYDAGRYAKEARTVMDQISAAGRLPVVVGGTGLYLRGLLGDRFHEDLPRDADLRARLTAWSTERLYRLLMRIDPRRGGELHPNDRVRIERAVELRVLLGHSVLDLPPVADGIRDQCFLIYINPDPELLRAKIRVRVEQMLAAGLIDEVRGLLAGGVAPDAKPMQSIGYLQVVRFFRGALPESELVDAIAVATAQYAKRQRTWFKKMAAELEISDAEKEWNLVQQAVSQALN